MQTPDDITKPSSKKALSVVSHQDLLAQMHRFRGSSASMVSLLQGNRLSTSPEYTYPITRKKNNRFHDNDYLVAMELIGLWMPIPEGERHNFIPRYEITLDGKIAVDTKYGFVNARSFQKYPPEDMCRYFLDNKVQNLGALSFLTLLLGGAFAPSKLGIAVSETTSMPYFTIKAGQFWTHCDDLSKKIHSTDIFQYILSEQAKDWWHTVVGEMNGHMISKLNYLFMTEIFPVVLRIHLTPDLIIQSIVKKILGDNPISDALIDFISKAKVNILAEYIEHLNTEDRALWSLFLENYALEVYAQYEKDIELYLTINELSLYADPLEWQLPMYKRAFHCNILNLNESRLGLLTLSEDILVRIHLFSELNKLIEENWSVLSRFGDAPYWQLANNNCINLHELMTREACVIELEDNSIEFQFGFLLGAIQYQHHHLAQFLINQFHGFVHKTIERTAFLTIDARFCLGQSLIFYCNKVKNKAIFDFLVTQGAVLEPAIVAKKNHSSNARRSNRTSFFVDNPNVSVEPTLVPREDIRPPTAFGRARSKKVYDFSDIETDLEKIMPSRNDV